MADKAKKSGGKKIGYRIRKNPLKTKDGARHEVAVEEAKETLLLCGAVSAAAKGAATLEVSVASSSSATGRFTATRRVKVC